MADFPQGCREFVLPRIGGEFPQNLAWREACGSNRGGDAQDVRPVALYHGLVDLSAGQSPQVRRRGRWIKRIESLRWQIPDPWCKPIAENGARGKDAISEAARVGELLADMTAGIVNEQTIEDVGCFACRCRDLPALRTAHIGQRRGYKPSDPEYCRISR